MNKQLPRNSYLLAKYLSNISLQLVSHTLIALNNMQQNYVEIRTEERGFLYLNYY
jgi:hypothetical protein